MIFRFVLLITIVINGLFISIQTSDIQDNDVNEGFCTRKEDCENDLHLFATNELNGMKYLLYDVNREKSFSIRRSIHINVARIIQNLGANWTLVLPPWDLYTPRYTWTEEQNGLINKIKWSDFFKIEPIQELIAVIEFDQFIEHVSNELDLILVLNRLETQVTPENQLKNYELNEENCKHIQFYEKDNQIYGPFFGYKDYLKAIKMMCLNLAIRKTTVLEGVLHNELKHMHSIFVQNMDLIQHQNDKDQTYWLFRRSIQLNDDVINRANKFRRKYFDSDDEKDKTYISSDWQLNKPKKQKSIGGNYLAIHWMMNDKQNDDRIVDQIDNESREYERLEAEQFSDDQLNVQQVAKQILIGLKSMNLTWTYVATNTKSWNDLNNEFKKLIKIESRSPDKYKLFRYNNKSNKLSPVELELIEQWICAHARLFIGTSNSMYTQQIQEQREILTLPSNSTFNVLCIDSNHLCEVSEQNRINY